MLDTLLKICSSHLLKMVWILKAHWAIYVKNEDLTPMFFDKDTFLPNLPKPHPWWKPIPLMFAFEDSFTLISRWSYMIKGTWESFSQDAGARSIIIDLQSHLLKMVWTLIAYWASYVKNEYLTPVFFLFTYRPFPSSSTLQPIENH